MTRNRHDPAPEPGEGPKNAAQNGQGAKASGGAQALSEAEVRAYLQGHPDFLQRNADLLDVLEPPRRQDGEGVVDLQQFMLDRLRGEIARLREARDELVLMSRANLAAQCRIHEATLAILSCRSFEELIEAVTTDLTVILDLDAVTICVEQPEEGENPPMHIGGVHQLAPGSVSALIGRGQGAALIADMSWEPSIFGSAAGVVRSAALLRMEISPMTPPAMLALGSRRPDQFDPSQGSELLQFLARCLERVVRQWLELPD